MEKIEVIVSLVMVILFFLFARYASYTGYVVESGVEVSQEVINEVQEAGKVDVIVVLKEEQPGLDFMTKQDVNSEQVLENLNEEEYEKGQELKSANAFSAEVSLSGLNKIKTNLNVERIELNHPMEIFLQDTINIIHAKDVHDMGYTGNAQGICIVDTGINYNHPDLNANYAGGFDIKNNDSDPMDDNGHGTHISGIVAANGGVKGIAKNAKIIAVKVFDASGYGSEADIIKGIEWCIEHKAEYNIVAISLSVGTSSMYSTYCDALFPSLSNAVNAAVNSGIAVVAATGNSGSTTGISSPACLQNSISVGSTDKADGIASYSNRNSFTTILAPGSSITSTWLSGTRTLSGTSMSVPHVSAEIAILKEFNSELSVSEIKTALIKGKSVQGVNQNFTRIDVLQAILSFDETAPIIGFVIPTPENNALVNNSLFVNITSNEKLSSAILGFNNQNISMDGNNLNFYLNKTAFSGDYSYKAYGYDLAGNIGISEERNVSIYNPLNIIFSPENKNVNIKEPENFTFSVSYTEQNLSTTWFKDNINAGTNNEYTFIGDYNSAGTKNITACVENQCKEWNLIINNTNRAPIFLTQIENKTWGENTNLSLSLNNHFTDPDNDILNYSYNIVENISVYILTNLAILEPDANFIGLRNIKFNARDSESNISSNEIRLEITNTIICGDGIIEGSEACDGSNLNSKTCTSFSGYIGGTLKCTSCQFDKSSCIVTGSGGAGGGAGGGGGGAPLEENFEDLSAPAEQTPEQTFETTSAAEPATVTEPNKEEAKSQEKITGGIAKESDLKLDSPLYYLIFIAVGLILLILILRRFGKL